MPSTPAPGRIGNDCFSRVTVGLTVVTPSHDWKNHEPAPTTSTHPASQVEDFDEISQVMKTLLEGESAGDVAKLKAAFHPDARMFGQAEGERYDLPISEYFDFAASAPANSEGNYRARVLSVQQTGDAAFVAAWKRTAGAARPLRGVDRAFHFRQCGQPVGVGQHFSCPMCATTTAHGTPAASTSRTIVLASGLAALAASAPPDARIASQQAAT